MELVSEEEKVQTKELPKLQSTFTYFEQFMFGATLKSPDGAGPFRLDEIARMDFPEWIFRLNSDTQLQFTDEELNVVRRKESFLSEYLNPIDPNSVIAGFDFELFFGDYIDGKGPEMIEFAFFKDSDKKRVVDRKLVGVLLKELKFYEEFEGMFRLDKVPGHPERRSLNPIRKT